MSQNTRRLSENSSTLLGKFVLESISIGMYDHPFMAIREYIQNSTDSIDLSPPNSLQDNTSPSIDITIDGRRGSLCIKDGGPGISASIARSTLRNLGFSNKDPRQNRGFRGIGRLSGLGYCNELVFVTKASGENVYSKNLWDCKKMRLILNQSENQGEARDIVDAVSTFSQAKYEGDITDSFFIVEMNDIRTSRNLLINVPAIKSYIAQVAPIPFDSNRFRFGEMIDNKLRSRVPNYNAYNIRVNNEQVFKPYIDRVLSGADDRWQEISNVIYLDLSTEECQFGFGWLPEIDLVGRIHPDTLVDGIRLRIGNMMLGNKDTLSELFRERRFNNYLAGEVHLTDYRLVPNARRDNIEDSEIKDILHNLFIKHIGLPYSKQIRDMSKIRSEQKKDSDIKSIVSKARDIISYGYVAELQRDAITDSLTYALSANESNSDEEIKELISRIVNSKHMLELNNGTLPEATYDVCIRIFERLYKQMASKSEAERLINTLCHSIVKM